MNFQFVLDENLSGANILHFDADLAWHWLDNSRTGAAYKPPYMLISTQCIYFRVDAHNTITLSE